MPVVQQRQLSPGELQSKKRRQFPKTPIQLNKALTRKEIRKLAGKKKREQIEQWQGANTFISDTAKAWNLTYHEVSELYSWVSSRVQPHNRTLVLTKLLRRKYNKESS